MVDYWFTFRIHDDSDYDDRYESLRDAMLKYCDGWWAEPTSFYLCSSELEIDALGKRLTAGLSASKDLLVIRYLSKDGSRYFGKVERLVELKQHLPSIKKL